MHPTLDELELAAAGHRSPATTRVIRHLLAGCPSCSAVLLSSSRAPIDYRIPEPPEHVLRIIANTDQVATKLLSLSHPHRLLLLSNRREYRTPAILHRLLQAADRLVQSDPRQAFLLANLSVETADTLDPQLWRETIVTDIRAEARIARGNAFRLLGDPVAAQTDFYVAEELMENCSGDPLLIAFFHSKAASLRLQTHGCSEALGHLRKARRSLVSIDEKAGLLRIQVQLAEVHARAHEFGKAISILRDVRVQAESLPCSDSLVVGTTINLALYLTDANRPLEALQEIQPVADRGSLLPRSLFYSLLWTRARLDRALTLFDSAIRQFGRLHACYQSEGLYRDALLVAIDLADTLMQAERWTEALELLRRVSSELQTWDYDVDGIRRWTAALTTVDQRIYSIAAPALLKLRQWQAVAPPPFPPGS